MHVLLAVLVGLDRQILPIIEIQNPNYQAHRQHSLGIVPPEIIKAPEPFESSGKDTKSRITRVL